MYARQMQEHSKMNWQDKVLNTLDEHRVSVFDLLMHILRTRAPKHAHHKGPLCARTNDILDLWSEQCQSEVEECAVRAATETYRLEILQMTQRSTGLHFQSTHASLSQLETFSMVEMGRMLCNITPNLWRLLGVLLDANTARRRAAPTQGHAAVDEDVVMDLGGNPKTASTCDWTSSSLSGMLCFKAGITNGKQEIWKCKASNRKQYRQT
jgi:hypothetical protein